MASEKPGGLGSEEDQDEAPIPIDFRQPSNLPSTPPPWTRFLYRWEGHAMEPVFIVDLSLNAGQIAEVAALLIVAFETSWPLDTMSAEAEVRKALDSSQKGRVALSGNGQVVGFIRG